MSTNEQTQLLREILKWIKFASLREVGDVLARALDSEQKRLVYHLSDGDRGAVEIAEAANISDRTVRRYWESWAGLGIVDSMKVRGGERYKKSFKLEDFGIEVPSLPSVSEEGDKQSTLESEEGKADEQ